MVLHRIRIEGSERKTVYRRLYDIEAHGVHARKDKPTHTAWIRHSKQNLIVYLIDGRWVSYGEVKTSVGESDEE